MQSPIGARILHPHVQEKVLLPIKNENGLDSQNQLEEIRRLAQ